MILWRHGHPRGQRKETRGDRTNTVAEEMRLSLVSGLMAPNHSEVKVRDLLVSAACVAMIILCAGTTLAIPDRLKVNQDGHFLIRQNGAPFFYLGDTAWELFHRLNREEADRYLQDRARKGFTGIQAVAIAELDGHSDPNLYGHLPLVDFDPSRPAVKDGPENDYWDHVDYIVDM